MKATGYVVVMLVMSTSGMMPGCGRRLSQYGLLVGLLRELDKNES